MPLTVVINRRSLSASLLLVVASTVAANPALTSNHSPTRAEWLAQSIQIAIYQTSNFWRTRIGVRVVVLEKEEQVAVVISVANGEPEPTANARANYISDVRAICMGVMARYDWAKGLKLDVAMV